MTDIKTSVLYVAGQPNMVTLDYLICTGNNENKWVFLHFSLNNFTIYIFFSSEFRLSYYPHRLEVFKKILKEVFGQNSNHEIHGDFKELDDVANPNPAFYIHSVEKFK